MVCVVGICLARVAHAVGGDDGVQSVLEGAGAGPGAGPGPGPGPAMVAPKKWGAVASRVRAVATVLECGC